MKRTVRYLSVREKENQRSRDRAGRCRSTGRAALRLLAALILTLGLWNAASAGLQGGTGTVYAAEAYSGWKTKNGCRLYYKKGVRVKGWLKIDGKYYYFNEKGVLQTNRIVGSKAKGYYYVDQTGVRVTSSPIKSAVKFVMKNSSSSQTREQRLRSCFRALCKYPYQRFYGDKPASGKIFSYASYMFKNKRGNCYRYASAMAYIARVLGYDSRVAVGGVTSRAYGSLSPHGWCEVKDGNYWKMIDCSMQRVSTRKELFLLKRTNYPFRFRCDKIFVMGSKNGKISWSRK